MPPAVHGFYDSICQPDWAQMERARTGTLEQSVRDAATAGSPTRTLLALGGVLAAWATLFH